MIAILSISICIRIAAMVWSGFLIRHTRDWRMGFLTLMIGLMATRQILTLNAHISDDGHGWTTEFFGLVVSVLAFFAVFFLEKLLKTQKQTEKALVQKDKNIAAAQLLAGISSWNLDVKTGSGNWSQDLTDRFGPFPSIPEERSAVFESYIHPDDVHIYKHNMESALAGASCSFIVRSDPAKGDMRFFSSLVSGEKDENEEIRHLIGISQDITDLKVKETAIRRQNKELEGLLELGKKLTQRVNQEDLFREIVTSVVETLPGADAASIWLSDADEQTISVRAWVGHDDAAMAQLQSVEANRSLLGLVSRNQGFTLINDTASNPHFQSIHKDIDRVQSVAGAPLMIEGRVIGLLYADSYTAPNTLKEEDGRLLQSIASLAVVAIENARLFEQQAAVSKQRLHDIEEERRRIALELHDQVGGQLTSLGLSISQAKQAEHSVSEAEETVNSLIEKVRSMSLELRPSMLDDLGLVPALRWLFDRYTGQTGIGVVFYEEISSESRPEEETEIAAFRIIQEALTNVTRHAETVSVQVLIHSEEDCLVIHVIDEGKGFDAVGVEKYKSVGLSGIRERVAMLDGFVDITSEPEIGTRVTAILPTSRTR